MWPARVQRGSLFTAAMAEWHAARIESLGRRSIRTHIDRARRGPAVHTTPAIAGARHSRAPQRVRRFPAFWQLSISITSAAKLQISCESIALAAELCREVRVLSIGCQLAVSMLGMPRWGGCEGHLSGSVLRAQC